jgi:hypothetical protein
MKTASKILIAVGGGLGAFALSRYVYKTVVLANQWDFEFVSITPTGIYPSLDGELVMKIINVSNVRLDMRNINFDVFSAGVKIGQIVNPKEINIAPNGNSFINVKLKVEYKNLLKALGSSYQAVKTLKDVPIDIRGTLELKGFLGWTTLPITYSTSGKELKAMYDESNG